MSKSFPIALTCFAYTSATTALTFFVKQIVATEGMTIDTMSPKIWANAATNAMPVIVSQLTVSTACATLMFVFLNNQVFASELVSVLTMCLLFLWVLFAMLFSGDGKQMTRIDARFSSAAMMKYCLGWRFSNQQFVDDSMSKPIATVDTYKSVALWFIALPQPATALGIDKDFGFNPFRKER